MNCEVVLDRFTAAEPLWVNCEPPDGLPNIARVGVGCDGDLWKSPLVLAKRLLGAEPIRFNSDGAFDGAGVVMFAG